MKLKHLVEITYGDDVDFSLNKLTSLPDDLPDKVAGNFVCGDNNLSSLEHCPAVVGGDFSCAFNKLTSLEHCPSQVGGIFNCYSTGLTSLKDIHKQVKKIGAEFWCHGNQIKSHILGIMLIEIGGKISTKLGNGTDVDAILNKWKNQGRRGVLGAQRELLDLGYEELAQL